SYQNREGGDVFVIRGQSDGFHQYFEKDESVRNITTAEFDREFSGGRKIIAKQGVAYFTRQIEIPDYLFDGRQFNSYTDISYFQQVQSHALVFGFNAVYDQFKEEIDSSLIKRDETRTTFGGYVQDNFPFTDNLSSRISVGLGYKAPSIFTEETEMLLFRGVLPIGNTLEAERSRGGTFDVNYKNVIGEKLLWSVNQMFFHTRIESPLVLLPAAGGAFRFSNAEQPIRSSGFETNLRAAYGLLKLFAGYTFTDAKARYLSGNQDLPLVPRSRLNSALLFEKEDSFKAGLEAYYSSSQFLSNGVKTQSF